MRFPSVSKLSEHDKDTRACAQFLVGELQKAGLEAGLLPLPPEGGHPLVYAEWRGAPGKPTIIFYGHYDVQPAWPLNQWRFPPFEPTIKGENIYGRGATDDKGQVMAVVRALRAIWDARRAFPVNIVFIIEGEEEAGGEVVARFVNSEEGKRKLRGDAVIICDTPMWAEGWPSLVRGIRGICSVRLLVKGPKRSLHQGHWGGKAPNPLRALTHILNSLQDINTGEILIPGFYRDVVVPTAEERKAFAKLPFDEEAHAAEFGVALIHEEGYTSRESATMRPAIDIYGLKGGHQGPEEMPSIPTEAQGGLIVRLVPNQDPATVLCLLRGHFERNTPRGITVETFPFPGALPVSLDLSGPVARAAAAAQEEIWGRPSVRIWHGGTIPVVSCFHEVLGLPVVLMGFGLPDDGLHGENEKFSLNQFRNGSRAIVRLLDRVGA